VQVLQAACVAGLALQGGCAGISAGADTESVEAPVDGIRYYEPAPFLLVYADGRGALKTEVLYLPDTTRKRVIDPYAVLASNNATLSFKDGTLTGTRSEVDETVVPAAVLESLKVAAVAAAAFARPGEAALPEAMLPPPALFRIVHDPDGAWRLVGDRSDNELTEGYPLGQDGKRVDIRVVQFEAPKAPNGTGDGAGTAGGAQ
jgi:hypothetical protein